MDILYAGTPVKIKAKQGCENAILLKALQMFHSSQIMACDIHAPYLMKTKVVSNK